MNNNIKGTKINKLPFELNKRGDLISFEGPLLSHFFDENGKNYLLNWIDNDDHYNRWLLFEISQIELYDFFNEKKSLRNLIKGSEEIIYFLDIDNEINFNKIILSSKSDIPNEYLPDRDSFYDDLLSTKYAKNLKNEINDTFSDSNIKDIKRKIKNFNSHLDDVNFISVLNQRNIINSWKEIHQLRSSYLPLLILHELFGDSHSKGLKHLIHRHNHAYTNPFEYNSYFYELENLLNTKVNHSSEQFIFRFHSSDEYNMKTIDKLYSVVFDILSRDPHKFRPQINLWKESLVKNDGNDKLENALNEILD